MARTRRSGSRAYRLSRSRQPASTFTPSVTRLAKQLQSDLVLTPPSRTNARVRALRQQETKELAQRLQIQDPNQFTSSDSSDADLSSSTSDEMNESPLSLSLSLSLDSCLFFKCNATRLHQSVRREMCRIELHSLLSTTVSDTIPLVVLLLQADSVAAVSRNEVVEILGLNSIRKRSWTVMEVNGIEVEDAKRRGKEWAKQVEIQRLTEEADARRMMQLQTTTSATKSASTGSSRATLAVVAPSEPRVTRSRSRSRSPSVSLSPSMSLTPASPASPSSPMMSAIGRMTRSSLQSAVGLVF